MRPMHGMAIIVPMVHQASSGGTPGGTEGTKAGLDPGSWPALLAPRLAYFAGVARHEHVTRAAQDMGVPQSTLSRAMVRLEADLGVTLFARRGRNVALT